MRLYECRPCYAVKQATGRRKRPHLSTHHSRPYETSKTYMKTLNIGYLVKKTCLLVSFYFIRFRALPVTHGTNQQSPS